MSKMQCCEYCGTIFDPKEGSCPICGSTRSHDAEPSAAGEPAPEKEVSMDDFLLELGVTKDADQTPEEKSAPRRNTGSPSRGELAGDPEADPMDLSFLDDLLSPGEQTGEDAGEQAPTDAPTAPTPVAPAPRKAASSPGTAPKSKARPQAEGQADRAARPRRTPRPEDGPTPVPTGEEADAPRRTGAEEGPGKKSSRKRGTITTRDKIVCLVLATLVCILGLFILYRFLRPHLADNTQTEPSVIQTESTVDLSCRSILVTKTLTLTEVGQTHVLEVTLDPANTTDNLAFSTDAPHVVTVTGEGVLTAVSSGTANITVTCGNVMAICTVTCSIEEQTEPTEATEATEPTETESTVTGPESLKLNRDDISFDTKGQTVRLTTGDYDDMVTWSSSDTSVVTVENGLVTAVGGGTAYIYATYGDLEARCIFRCRFESSNGPGEGEDDGITISHTDVSISIDESFTLRLKDAEGNTLEVTWIVDDANICSVAGNKVTGLASGRTVVRCTYNGTEYACIVRVR